VSRPDRLGKKGIPDPRQMRRVDCPQKVVRKRGKEEVLSPGVKISRMDSDQKVVR